MAQGTISDDFSGKTAQVRGVHDTLSDQCSKTHTGSDVENIDPEAENEPHIDEKNTRSNSLYNEYLCRDKDSWTLVLLLDHREVLSRRNRSILERKLTERGVTCEVRGLHIGDMIWIARRTREFVLNVIVERKEVRDLSGSIIDRRFAEQKHRLQACGLHQVVYLVEGSMTQQTTIMKDGMEDALCLTEFRNDFLVHMSQNADETVAFLSAIHRRLLARFPRDQCFNPKIEGALCPSKFLPSEATTFTALFAKPLISFGEFNRKFQKRTNFSVSEMYQRMLTQIPSLSTSKIAAIVHQFKNFTELMEAMNPSEQLGGDEMDASVSRLGHIRYGENNRLLDARTRNIIRILLQSENYELS
ncbi:unnamed protein product [Albugo candida]|nr:unnamed protein product [Albugo candida]|eukprot:CCI47874.1 unnamed protein product [Albugo candida]